MHEVRNKALSFQASLKNLSLKEHTYFQCITINL